MQTDVIRVICETRICPPALCPVGTNGMQYPSRNYWREESGGEDGHWFRWRTAGGCREAVPVEVLTDTKCPWHPRNTNIYRDHCIYTGNDEIGYFRRKSQISKVNGYMVDFDSHSAEDLPMEQISQIVLSKEFQSAVPCSRIIMTGNGCQIHIPFVQAIEGEELERKMSLTAYEAAIHGAMRYFEERWHLRPDPACKDVNRLHRHHPSFNTKKLTGIGDEEHRIPVQMVLNRDIEPTLVSEFVTSITEQYPAKTAPARRHIPITGQASNAKDAAARAMEPPCIRALWERGSAEGHRNADRFPLLARFHAAGITETDAAALIHEFNSRCQPPDDVAAVTSHVAGYYGNPAGEAGCTYMRERCGTCIHQEFGLEEAKRACPFAAGNTSPKQHPYLISKAGNIVRRECRLSRDGEAKEALLPVTEVGNLVVTEVIQDGDTRYYRGKIANGTWERAFELPASLWVNRMRFAEAVKAVAGENLVFYGRNAEHAAMASEQLCPEKTLRIATDFGWDKDFAKYYGVDCVVTADSIRPPTSEYFRCPHDAPRKLHLAIPQSEEQVSTTLRHIKDDLMHLSDYGVMQAVIGVVFSAPFVSLLRRRATTTNAVPSLVIQGPTGRGKSGILMLAASFFGVVRDTDMISFSSTPRVINDLGYWYRDAIYVIDDLKWSSLNAATQTQIIQVLQAYADGHGRNRLSHAGGGEWEPEAGKEIRGCLCISAEDLPSGESSIFGRFMIVNLSESVTDTARYGRCLAESRGYSAVMAAFLHWYLSVTDCHSQMLCRFDQYRVKFEEGVPRDRLNLVRVCSQLALNMVGYRMFLRFATGRGIFTESECESLAAAHESRLTKLRDQRLAQIASESPAEKFLTMVASLVASGGARLDDGGDGRKNTPVIGFQEYDGALNRQILYLDPKTTYGLVQRAYDDLHERIPFNEHSLGQQLQAQGYLARKDMDRWAYSKVHKGRKGRYYAIDLNKFEWNAAEEEDTDWKKELTTPKTAENIPEANGNASDDEHLDPNFLLPGAKGDKK